MSGKSKKWRPVPPCLVVGNWKMHGTRREAALLARRVREGAKGLRNLAVVLAPPFTALSEVARVLRGSSLELAAQNTHWENQGAFTGEVSPRMLEEIRCRFVLIGHSERRHIFQESDAMVARKMAAALATGLCPILCVGETLGERRQAKTRRVLARQLGKALKGPVKNGILEPVIAYEPVWAIGTGLHATPTQVEEAHHWIRQVLERLLGNSKARRSRILYGGSVRPDNTAELAAVGEVDGLLVGGASLDARSFLKVITTFSGHSRLRRR